MADIKIIETNQGTIFTSEETELDPNSLLEESDVEKKIKKTSKIKKVKLNIDDQEYLGTLKKLKITLDKFGNKQIKVVFKSNT